MISPMTRASPRMAVRCSQCGGAGELAFDDSFVSGRLRYWEAFRCSTCPRRYEADGWGRLPDALRSLALAHHAICVDPGAPAPRLAALRAMRTLFGGTPGEARARWAMMVAGEPMTAGEGAELRSLVPGLSFIECTVMRPVSLAG
jgi:hypothetical protein